MKRGGIKGAGLFAKGYDAGFFIGIPPDRFDLPHEPVHPRLMLLLHQVIEEAFRILRTQPLFQRSQLEDEITTQLHGVLENDIRQRRFQKKPNAIPGFDEQYFEAISRHSGATNYKAEKIKKEPDLYFKLKPAYGQRVAPTEYAIFAECKPVDGSHSSRADYCRKGLIRFVEGDYAWAMQDALMIGYTKDRSISGHLVPVMAEPEMQAEMATVEVPRPVVGSSATLPDPLHVSRHRRNFHWAWGKGKASGINIYHSWHDCRLR